MYLNTFVGKDFFILFSKYRPYSLNSLYYLKMNEILDI